MHSTSPIIAYSSGFSQSPHRVAAFSQTSTLPPLSSGSMVYQSSSGKNRPASPSAFLNFSPSQPAKRFNTESKQSWSSQRSLPCPQPNILAQVAEVTQSDPHPNEDNERVLIEQLMQILSNEEAMLQIPEQLMIEVMALLESKQMLTQADTLDDITLQLPSAGKILPKSMNQTTNTPIQQNALGSSVIDARQTSGSIASFHYPTTNYSEERNNNQASKLKAKNEVDFTTRSVSFAVTPEYIQPIHLLAIPPHPSTSLPPIAPFVTNDENSLNYTASSSQRIDANYSQVREKEKESEKQSIESSISFSGENRKGKSLSPAMTRNRQANGSSYSTSKNRNSNSVQKTRSVRPEESSYQFRDSSLKKRSLRQSSPSVQLNSKKKRSPEETKATGMQDFISTAPDRMSLFESEIMRVTDERMQLQTEIDNIKNIIAQQKKLKESAGLNSKVMLNQTKKTIHGLKSRDEDDQVRKKFLVEGHQELHAIENEINAIKSKMGEIEAQAAKESEYISQFIALNEQIKKEIKAEQKQRNELKTQIACKAKVLEKQAQKWDQQFKMNSRCIVEVENAFNRFLNPAK